MSMSMANDRKSIVYLSIITAARACSTAKKRSGVGSTWDYNAAKQVLYVVMLYAETEFPGMNEELKQFTKEHAFFPFFSKG